MAYKDYYPHDAQEERYMRWLEAPGDGLGMVLGDAPSVEEVLNRGGTIEVRKSPLLVIDVTKADDKSDDESEVPLRKKMSCSKCGTTAWTTMKAGIGDCCISKALPKGKSSSDGAKKAKTKKASKEKAGATGKVRSSYPNETSGAGKNQQQGSTQPKKKPNPAQVPNDQEEGPPVASPGDLANMLEMSVSSLQRIAHRFRDNTKLGGRSGFVSFMKTRLKTMARKHKLDGDYFGLIFDALAPKK